MIDLDEYLTKEMKEKLNYIIKSQFRLYVKDETIVKIAGVFYQRDKDITKEFTDRIGDKIVSLLIAMISEEHGSVKELELLNRVLMLVWVLYGDD